MNAPALKVLIIDDDPAMTEMQKDFYEKKFPGSVISAYSSGEAALKGIYMKPDVIVLDHGGLLGAEGFATKPLENQVSNLPALDPKASSLS